jgi:hypothetical protein
MTESRLTDHALDDLLRASAPRPLPDDGFATRTMAAVDHAARGLPARRRATPVAPLAIARALAAENARHAAQARLWRWAFAGVIAGFLLLFAAMALSPAMPDGFILAPPPAPQWGTLCVLMSIGAIWLAIRELRNN